MSRNEHKRRVLMIPLLTGIGVILLLYFTLLSPNHALQDPPHSPSADGALHTSADIDGPQPQRAPLRELPDQGLVYLRTFSAGPESTPVSVSVAQVYAVEEGTTWQLLRVSSIPNSGRFTGANGVLSIPRDAVDDRARLLIVEAPGFIPRAYYGEELLQDLDDTGGLEILLTPAVGLNVVVEDERLLASGPFVRLTPYNNDSGQQIVFDGKRAVFLLQRRMGYDLVSKAELAIRSSSTMVPDLVPGASYDGGVELAKAAGYEPYSFRVSFPDPEFLTNQETEIYFSLDLFRRNRAIVIDPDAEVESGQFYMRSPKSTSILRSALGPNGEHLIDVSRVHDQVWVLSGWGAGWRVREPISVDIESEWSGSWRTVPIEIVRDPVDAVIQFDRPIGKAGQVWVVEDAQVIDIPLDRTDQGVQVQRAESRIVLKGIDTYPLRVLADMPDHVDHLVLDIDKEPIHRTVNRSAVAFKRIANGPSVVAEAASMYSRAQIWLEQRVGVASNATDVYVRLQVVGSVSLGEFRFRWSQVHGEWIYAIAREDELYLSISVDGSVVTRYKINARER